MILDSYALTRLSMFIHLDTLVTYLSHITHRAFSFIVCYSEMYCFPPKVLMDISMREYNWGMGLERNVHSRGTMNGEDQGEK